MSCSILYLNRFVKKFYVTDARIEYKPCGKYVEGTPVQGFFFSTWQWKSAKWKQTERLTRQSRF